jgi:hypothetical protein
VGPQPRDQHARAPGADARHAAPPAPAAGVAERDQVAECDDALPRQAPRYRRTKPQADRVIGRGRSGGQLRGGLDHLERHGRQARVAVLANRSLEVFGKRGRAVQQRQVHQVVAHRLEMALEQGRRVLVWRRVRIVIARGDRRQRHALHPRAQRREITARVGARRWQRELFSAGGHSVSGARRAP